ncbi:MAG: DUF4359 domain-containing protein [Leptolyngbya sp. SIO1E4]|nr:DUF4359 domain-containing protein [Leptolyngbya sp. SIO1E4]
MLLSVLLLAIATGGLVVTNPDLDAYEQYASRQAEQYLTEEICTELPKEVNDLLGGQCVEVVQTLQPNVERLIRDRTERLNLGVASIYRTSLGIPELAMLPRYEIETIGILGRFITYRATQVQ